MPRPIKDISGKIFGRLTVIEMVGRVDNRTICTCKCECGNMIDVRADQMQYGKIKSCGCIEKERINKARNGIRMQNLYEYDSWMNAQERCYSEKSNRYHRYGARGIKMCDKWLSSFEDFLFDMGKKPSRNYTLERIDNDGDYCPENCKWLEKELQPKNTRRNVWYEIKGKRQILSDWARDMYMSPKGLSYLLKKMTFEEVVNKYIPTF